MIADLLDGLGSALSDAFGGFFLSARADSARYRRRHPGQATYAPPIVRHHQQWPHESWPGGGGQHQPWPYERWPGECR
jgi:hypothetical protein